MKLSNKVLLGFFGFLLLYLTAVFVELRLTGIHNIISDENSIAETVDLPNINYLVLNNIDRNINVAGGDRSQLEVRSFSGDLMKRLTYKVSGDTLRLTGLQSEEIRTIRITVFVPKASLRGVSVKSSVVEVSGLQLEHLSISQNAGRIWMSNSHLSNIQLDLSNDSFLDISTADIDTLSVAIEGSQVHVSNRVRFVQGTVTNSSSLQLNDIGEIQLKKDESSKLNVY